MAQAGARRRDRPRDVGLSNATHHASDVAPPDALLGAGTGGWSAASAGARQPGHRALLPGARRATAGPLSDRRPGLALVRADASLASRRVARPAGLERR